MLTGRRCFIFATIFDPCMVSTWAVLFLCRNWYASWICMWLFWNRIILSFFCKFHKDDTIVQRISDIVTTSGQFTGCK